MSDLAAYTVCAAAGLVAGTLNVFAGGGSFLTLPILLFLGLPAGVANGTNRVGVLAQSVSAVLSFHAYRVMDWRWALAASMPILAGAAVGTCAALVVPDLAFRRILASSMLALTVWTLWRDALGAAVRSEPRPPGHWASVVGFFGAGIYGGFLQAGVGFLLLALTTTAGLDLVRGNAVKVLAILLQTLLSLGIFAGTGNVHWPLGLALAAGYTAGGVLGARMTVLKGHRWLQRAVTVTIVFFAILLWLTD
ncbi:MAG: TSUP family transporter [Luteitalea sp.]|nr:TSUP family transporter [Luteitalea sp.]